MPWCPFPPDSALSPLWVHSSFNPRARQKGYRAIVPKPARLQTHTSSPAHIRTQKTKTPPAPQASQSKRAAPTELTHVRETPRPHEKFLKSFATPPVPPKTPASS